jgi:hypothetical protein
VLTAVVIIAVATAVPEVRRALAAARRREPGTGNWEQKPVANSDSGSRFPVPGSPS